MLFVKEGSICLLQMNLRQKLFPQCSRKKTNEKNKKIALIVLVIATAFLCVCVYVLNKHLSLISCCPLRVSTCTKLLQAKPEANINLTLSALAAYSSLVRARNSMLAAAVLVAIMVVMAVTLLHCYRRHLLALLYMPRNTETNSANVWCTMSFIVN